MKPIYTPKGAAADYGDKTKKSTNLTDKNGNEIFEGDTLRCENRNGVVTDYVVEWSVFWEFWVGVNFDDEYAMAPPKFEESEKID